MIAVRVAITGRVQGVGFRAWVHAEAVKRNLTGWVRNRRDGSVEAQFEGEDDSVRAMINACRQGPRSARVEHVTETLAEPTNAEGFQVRGTA